MPERGDHRRRPCEDDAGAEEGYGPEEQLRRALEQERHRQDARRFFEAAPLYRVEFEKDGTVSLREKEYAYWQVCCLRAVGKTKAAKTIAERLTRGEQVGSCPYSFAFLCAAAGRPEKAAKALEAANDERSTADEYEAARVHAVRGDTESSIRCLEKAAELGHRIPPKVPPDPELAPVADDPRVQKLIARIRRGE